MPEYNRTALYSNIIKKPVEIEWVSAEWGHLDQTNEYGPELGKLQVPSNA